MTVTNQLQARDDMMKLFNDGWNAADWTYTNGKPTVRFQGREKNDPPPPDASYARVTITHSGGEQTGFRGDSGKRMVCKTGTITVQSFGHLSGGKGLEFATFMAIIAERCFSGKTSPNGVWFRRIRSNEVGQTGSWFQLNTYIDFEYNELR
jgi:hypothetical protein